MIDFVASENESVVIVAEAVFEIAAWTMVPSLQPRPPRKSVPAVVVAAHLHEDAEQARYSADPANQRCCCFDSELTHVPEEERVLRLDSSLREKAALQIDRKEECQDEGRK